MLMFEPDLRPHTKHYSPKRRMWIARTTEAAYAQHVAWHREECKKAHEAWRAKRYGEFDYGR